MPYLQPNLATRYTSKPVPGVNHPYRVTDGVGKFTRGLDKQSGGLFYFAGHDVEFNGSNDLIPVDADIVDEEDVDYESINAGRLLNGLELANNGFNLVIFDAPGRFITMIWLPRLLAGG